MTKLQKSVRTFMEMGGHELPTKPTELTLEQRKLCAALILEEALETINKGLGLGVDDNEGGTISMFWVEFIEHSPMDFTEFADGAGDTAYVLMFAANLMGINMEPVEAEICRSNLTKFNWTDQEVDEACAKGYSVQRLALAGMTAWKTCVKNQNGKIQKPAGYSKANIQAIMEGQGK